MFSKAKNDFWGLGGTDYLVGKCHYCKGACTKAGKQRTGMQKMKCKACGKYQQSNYSYQACKPESNRWIIEINRESCGISSISRLLKISKTTVIGRIKQLSRKVSKPLILKGKNYEVDELRTLEACVRLCLWG